MATLIPHVHPDLPPGFPPFSIGARLPRTAVGPRASGARPTGWWRSGSSRGGASTTTAARRSGLPPLPYVHTGLSRGLTMVGTFPQLEYPRAWPSWLRVVGPLLWEPGGPARRAARRFRPGRARGPLDLPGPRRTGCSTRALAGLADEPVRVIAICVGPGPRGAGERRARALDVLRRDDAPLRPRDHPRRPRHRRPRAGLRLPGADLARGRRHGRERGAGRLGGRRACGSRRASARRGACGWPSPRAGSPRLRARACELAAWAQANPGPPPPRPSSNAGPRRDRAPRRDL